MPARSIGTGTLSFGMVSIPIRTYSAGESASAVSFNLLHAKCGSRLKQQYICPKDNEIVPRDEMVKGYEFAKDQYVIFTDEELKALRGGDRRPSRSPSSCPSTRSTRSTSTRRTTSGPTRAATRRTGCSTRR